MESQLFALEEAINLNLGLLSNNTMTLKFKNTMEEKLEILIRHENVLKPFFILSGGEKKRVKLAVTFGVSDFIETPIKWRIGDEIDNDLDSIGIEKIKELLVTKQDVYQQFLFATLRHDMADIANQVIEL